MKVTSYSEERLTIKINQVSALYVSIDKTSGAGGTPTVIVL
jgi:hypothetical protein